MKKISLNVVNEILDNEDLAIEYHELKKKEKKTNIKERTYEDEENYKSRKKTRINKIKNGKF